MDRNNFFRCKYCGELFSQNYLREIAERDGLLEDIDKNGYKCPNGCKQPFNQPPYESPLQ